MVIANESEAIGAWRSGCGTRVLTSIAVTTGGAQNGAGGPVTRCPDKRQGRQKFLRILSPSNT